MAKPKISTKKTMDVAKPGESTPSVTSRPVIVTHRPIVKDPMVKETDADKSESKLSSASPIGKTMQPPTAIKILKDEKPKDDEATEDNHDTGTQPATTEKEAPVQDVKPKVEEVPSISTDEPDAKSETEKPAEEPVKSETVKSETEKTDDNPKPENGPDDSSGDGEVAPTTEDEQTMVKKKQEDLESQAEKQRHELIDKLVAEKTYFLPIGKVTRQRGNKKALIILILVILAALAGFYSAVKFGLIDLPFKLPF